jgi:hypothetical protein
MANEFIARKGIISLDGAQVTGSLSVTGNISASIFTGSFVGDGSQLSGVSAGFPFTGSAEVTGSLTVTGSISATTFFGDGSQLTGIGSPVPVTATVNTGSSPLTLTTQSIVVADSTDGNLIINLPDLNAIVGTSDQKPIVVYKNDYSQNVIYVNPSGSQLVNGASQDIIVSIQLAVIYNPTSAGWVTEGTSAQSLAELELFFLPLTETGSLATTGSNTFIGNQIVTGSLTVTGGINATITGSATSASYVEYVNVANKPALVSSSAQIVGYNIFATTGSNQFNGSQAITGSLTVTGQVVAQTLNVQQVTSSIVYSSGSNIFGNTLGNTQQFTGSLQVTGSTHYLLGSVGIGTTSSSANLHVVRANDGGSGTPGVILSTANGANDIVRFQDGTTTVAVVKNSGDLGVGVSSLVSPGGSRRLLQISNSTSGALIALGSSTTESNNPRIFSGQYDLGFAAGVTTGVVDFYTNDALRMRITSGGNVGIGTDSPSAISTFTTLDIRGATGGGIRMGRTSISPFNLQQDGTDAYLNNVAAGAIYFYTTDTERMRITSGGNTEVRSGNILNIYRTDNTRALQLSTTSNECLIDAWAASSEPLMLRSNGTGGRIVFHTNGGERVRITSDGTLQIGNYTALAADIQLASTTAGYGSLLFGDGSTGTDTYRGYIQYQHNGDYMILATSSTERMRITSDGNVLINNIAIAPLFSGENSTTGTPNMQSWNKATSGDNKFVEFYTEGGGGTLRGSIDFNRAATLTRYNTTSDKNLKNIIGDSDGKKSIEILNSTKIRVYSWKEDKTNKSQIGVIAQELFETYKGAVSVGSDNELLGTEDYKPWGVDKTAFTFHLIAGFQEHEKIIKELQSQIESLKAEIQTLKQ